jgi:S1-C subfamily serine protease
MKVKQNIISFLLGMAIMLPVGGYAASEIIAKAVNVPVIVDGAQIDTEVYNINGSNFTPARAVAEAMGGTVEWIDGEVRIETPKTDIETAVKNCKDSCVMIYAYKGDYRYQGSGFIYNGYIITAKHVVDGVEKIDVFLDDSIYSTKATITPIDTDLDISVLKAYTTNPSVVLGDSDKLIEGQKVIAITSPAGVKNAVDECLYSGVTYAGKGNFIGVSDSNMDAGSSGGAIFNVKNELIGMVVGGVKGNSAAIPINDVKSIFEQLK